ncbi:MAG: hypothetical protein HY327_08415 [Chloroflexi bacterium]|nr:hypothetical protein [Chloroflexota bacterium]
MQNFRLQDFVQRHLNIPVFAALTVVVAIVYLPSFFSGFISDDFDFLHILVFNSRELVNGDPAAWDEWFLRSINGYVYFRPFGHALALVDFLVWNVHALGYHITSALMHILATFAVCLLSRELIHPPRGTPLTTSRTVVFAALLFAVLPVHVDAVTQFAARYDVVCAFWFFLSVFFFIRYRRGRKLSNYLWTLASFTLALLSKELALVLPIVLVAYDALYHSNDFFHIGALIRRYAAFALIVPVYFSVRVFFLGRVAARGLEYLGEGWQSWLDATVYHTFFPAIGDVTPELLALACLIALLLVLFAVWRARREMIFGILWIPITYLPTITTNASDYSFYIASFGMALVAASAINSERIARFAIPPRLRTAVALALFAAYGVGTFQWDGEYRRATEVASAIVDQVKRFYPVLALDARLVFVGVPDKLPNDILVYRSGFGAAVQLVYGNPQLQVSRFQKFPVWLDKPDRTFFFLVDHRRVSPREDIGRDLGARQKCASTQTPRVEWNFSTDAQGWEAWNELENLRVRDGALTMRAIGNDPNLGSPVIEVPAFNFGDIELTMRARAEQPSVQGKIYWQAQDQKDFSPNLFQTFAVNADDQWHTYRVDLAATGKLFIGDQIVRLRLDPINAPGEVEIKSIRVSTVCLTAQGTCECR